MRHVLLVLTLLAGVVQAGSVKDREWKQTAFGERGVYQLESQFSYISTWGPTDLHDRITTANGGSVSLSNGFLEVASGTSSNATADLETVERVIYESGRQLEASIKIGVKDAPTGGATAEWGIGTDDNGAYFRLDDGTLSAVYEAGGTEVETARASMRGDDGTCGRFDPVDDPGIYVVRFSWYGAGGAAYYVYFQSDRDTDTLTECLLHWEAPDSDGESWDNPNLPIFARVDNQTSGDDVVLTVGGRRAGTQGSMTQRFRMAGDHRSGQSVAAADGLVPLICLRREADFPTASALNSVRLIVAGLDIATDKDATVRFVVDPDLTGASFGNATFAVDSETALESDTSATALSNPKYVSGPYLVTGGQGGKTNQVTKSDRVSVPFIGEDPTCLAADVDVDAVITSAWRVNEGW